MTIGLPLGIACVDVAGRRVKARYPRFDDTATTINRNNLP